MADEPPEAGTLIIVALLLLALGFAGYWISHYAEMGRAPWDAVSGFVVAAIVIVGVGLARYLRRGGS